MTAQGLIDRAGARKAWAVAPTPENEEARLEALRESGLLDGAPEEEFDRFTRLAARMFEAPVALFTLVAETKIVFKSAIGLAAREHDREASLCSQTILCDTPLVVPDLEADPRFCGNPLVCGPAGFRFYAGAPLTTRDGHAVGVLCVLDTEPRAPLSEEDRAALMDLAATAVELIDRRRDIVSQAWHRHRHSVESCLDAVFRASPLALVATDLDGHVTAWNPAAERIFGWTAEEAIGRFMPHVGNPFERDWESLSEMLHAGQSFTGHETERCHKDGSKVDVSISAAPMTAQHRGIIGCLAVIEDISERTLADRIEDDIARRIAGQGNALLRLARSDELSAGRSDLALALVIEVAVEQLAIGRAAIWAWNEAAERLECMQLHADGRTVLPANLSIDWRLCPKFFKALNEGRGVAADDVRRHPAIDPALLPYFAAQEVVATICAPIRLGGKMIGVIAVSQIGEPRRWRPDEISFTGSLADLSALAIESGRRVKAVEAAERARFAAEAANEAKSQFLANMSHELRTPLNAVIGFADMLEGEFFGPLGDERYRGYAGDIAASGRHLLGIINDVLDLAKAGAGELSLSMSAMALSEPIEEAVRMVRLRAKETGLKLTLTLDPKLGTVEADRLRVRQIVTNLLSNAIKFTEAPGCVAVEAACEGGGCRITMRDSGIGMTPEDAEQALEPFSQIDTGLARSYEGTGLGLPIAARLTEMHGGFLEIETAPGAGTCVSLWLPRRQPTAQPHTPIAV